MLEGNCLELKKVCMVELLLLLLRLMFPYIMERRLNFKCSGLEMGMMMIIIIVIIIIVIIIIIIIIAITTTTTTTTAAAAAT